MTFELAEITHRVKQILREDIVSIQAFPNAEQYIVVEVNSEWICKFRRDPADRCLEHEQRFLPLFAEMAPIPVPEIRHTGTDFIAYRKIPGERLTTANFKAVAAKSRKELARQLGEFLTALHSFPVEEAEEIGLDESWGGWREQAHQVFRRDLAPLLRAETRKGALALLDLYAGLPNRTVIHGDFAPFNILIDPAEERISGVIDFGHMTIEEEARDFIDIARSFGASFLMDVISNYESDDVSTLYSRVQIRRQESVLGDAVHSFQTGQEERLRQRLAELELIFSQDRGTA